MEDIAMQEEEDFISPLFSPTELAFQDRFEEFVYY